MALEGLIEYYQDKEDINPIKGNFKEVAMSLLIIIMMDIGSNNFIFDRYYLFFILAVLCINIVSNLFYGFYATVDTVRHDEVKEALNSVLQYSQFRLDEENEEDCIVYKDKLSKIILQPCRGFISDKIKYYQIRFKYIKRSNVKPIYSEFMNKLYLHNLIQKKKSIWDHSSLLWVVVLCIASVYFYIYK